METLLFYEKSVYGQDKIYPVKEIETAIQALTGRRTVDMSHLKALKALGFKIVLNKANFEALCL